MYILNYNHRRPVHIYSSRIRYILDGMLNFIWNYFENRLFYLALSLFLCYNGKNAREGC